MAKCARAPSVNNSYYDQQCEAMLRPMFIIIFEDENREGWTMCHCLLRET